MHAAFFIRVSRGSANAILRRYKVLLILPVSFILVTFARVRLDTGSPRNRTHDRRDR